MKKRKHHLEIFSLAFLDIIACGFGAIVMIVLLSKTSIENDKKHHDTKDIASLISSISKTQNALSKKNTQKDDLYQKTQNFAGDVQKIKNKITLAQKQQQKLMEELRVIEQKNAQIAAQKENIEKQQKAETQATTSQEIPPEVDFKEVGGIPVDSEYIIFVVDTSTSMTQHLDALLHTINGILSAHPVVKGFQVLSDNGSNLFNYPNRKWIKDTPRNRKKISTLLRSWTAFSNSSPVEGVQVAIQNYARSKNRISIFIFGDDFSGVKTYDNVVKKINDLNKNKITQEKKARIHAVAFGKTKRFATLMRAITQQNNGSFIAMPYR